MSESKLLRVENLKLYFRTAIGDVQAVDGVDLELGYNEAIVILGESGCGKTSLARAILRLLPTNISTYSGEIFVGGTELMSLDDEEFRRKVRWVMLSMVPQAAMNALNPVLRVGDQVAEPMIIHGGVKKEEALIQAKEIKEQLSCLKYQ